MKQAAWILEQARSYAYQTLHEESSGHDWWHIVRVTNTALEIARQENANLFICELAALLHDVADAKLNESEAAGLQKVSQWLDAHQVALDDAKHVLHIIANMSFKGGHHLAEPLTLEGQIVQDADRLDAIGAIGIARAMCYSGHTGRPIHDPAKMPRETLTVDEYRSGNDTAIMHFYEKLLKVKDRMNTRYAKQLAAKRHQFLEVYLEQFYCEWDGKC
ncbi:MAG: HD domain-containing protein [Aerococcaceae bacterium]|nr:HD domain-containing protein [Aerococcaceae bacterium]